MDFRGPSFIARVSAPLRGVGHRVALGLLVLLSFGVMFLGKADARFVERARASIADVATPILEAIAEPIAAIDRVVAHLGELAALREENRRLREDVARLRAWHAAALRFEAENKSLRDIVKYRGPDRSAFVTARIVADGHGPFVKSMLVNIGERDGIEKGQAAVTDLGLVGRVTALGDRSARILMITDLNSRIPVLVEDSRARAILAGDNSERPQLVFLPQGTRLTVGQRIITSGHGGSLPHGIPVGVVSSIEGGFARVRPFVDWERLEYVQIVDFEVESRPTVARRVTPSSAARLTTGVPPATGDTPIAAPVAAPATPTVVEPAVAPAGAESAEENSPIGGVEP